jgi:hypothetical protein
MVMPKSLAVLVVALLAFGCAEPEIPPPQSSTASSPPAPSDPFGRMPRHPPEVVRLMNLMPSLPAEGTLDDFLHHLGLQANWTGGSICGGGGAVMTWDIAPGYRFSLAISMPRTENGRSVASLSEASIAAQGKPGFPADHYHTIYPYRNWTGMVAK